MEEESLDLTKSKITSQDELYLSVIKESIEENYPISDIESELAEAGLTLSELADSKKLESFMDILNNKYEENN